MKKLILAALLVSSACGNDDDAAIRDGTTGGETWTTPTNEADSPPIVSGDGGGEPTCANASCEPGTHCEIVQVQCIRAPCPPLPQCVPD